MIDPPCLAFCFCRFVPNFECCLARRISQIRGCRRERTIMIYHRKKHITLNYLSAMTVARESVPRVWCAPVEAFNQGDSCAAQAFKYQLKKRFLRRSAVSCANSSGNVYLTSAYDSTFTLASLRASCGVSELHLSGRDRILHQMVHIR